MIDIALAIIKLLVLAGISVAFGGFIVLFAKVAAVLVYPVISWLEDFSDKYLNN